MRVQKYTTQATHCDQVIATRPYAYMLLRLEISA